MTRYEQGRWQLPLIQRSKLMCEGCVSRRPIVRRGVLKLALATAAGLISQEVVPVNAAGPAKSENVLSPDAALDRLMKGNAR